MTPAVVVVEDGLAADVLEEAGFAVIEAPPPTMR
jgi:hypothetical protein